MTGNFLHTECKVQNPRDNCDKRQGIFLRCKKGGGIRIINITNNNV